jgi:hypothetical protein
MIAPLLLSWSGSGACPNSTTRKNRPRSEHEIAEHYGFLFSVRHLLGLKCPFARRGRVRARPTAMAMTGASREEEPVLRTTFKTESRLSIQHLEHTFVFCTKE